MSGHYSQIGRFSFSFGTNHILGVFGALLFNRAKAIMVGRIEYCDFGRNVKSIVAAIFAEVLLEVF